VEETLEAHASALYTECRGGLKRRGGLRPTRPRA
jgi:hypothetical protein